MGYEVWLPELPEAWQIDIDKYWNFLKNFDYNHETILIGHSSGGSTVFALLNKLPTNIKIKLAISVAGFAKNEWPECAGLFKEEFNWEKIKKQAEKIIVVWSPSDPYVKKYQTDYICKKLRIAPTLFENMGHFNLEGGEKFRKFPELLETIKKNVSV